MKKIVFCLMALMMLLNELQAGDFVRNSTKDIVTDTRTLLQWQDNGDVKVKKIEWSEAITYCEALSLGGYDNWRLPNKNELYYIADRTIYYPAMDSTFKNVSKTYWSSTTFAGDTNDAWVIIFTSGDDDWDNKSSSNYVRCVREQE